MVPSPERRSCRPAGASSRGTLKLGELSKARWSLTNQGGARRRCLYNKSSRFRREGVPMTLVPVDDPLYRDPDLAQFYDAANRWGTDFDYCVALASDATSVLDLGCGTGELATALAEGRKVIGVDPASAMLDIARKRSG